MEKNPSKRRLITRDTNSYSQQADSKLFVDFATNTECQIPMQLNAWTQTSTESYSLTNSNSLIIDELQNRVNKLEQLFRSLNTNQRTLPSFGNNEQVIPTEQHFEPTQPTNYKIVTSEAVGYNEPIEIVFEEETSFNDLNTSNDSNRLEICIPKSDEQQNQEEQSIQQHQQIMYQTEAQQDQHGHHQTGHKYHNNSNIDISPALETPISTSIQQPSYYMPVSQSPIETKHEVKKEKIKKIFRGSTTNLNEITSSLQDESISSNNSIPIGPHNTRIPAHVYETIDWTSATAATRKLLITIFDRETLATHTMTGKPSPAFRGRNMPTKHQLDSLVVYDIIYTVSRKCGVHEKEVRNAITTKCADENKMAKQRELKRRTLAECNKENVKNIKSPVAF